MRELEKHEQVERSINKKFRSTLVIGVGSLSMKS